jgi:ubiquinone/menaquinone biosynthesis C-methylase UbiE
MKIAGIDTPPQVNRGGHLASTRGDIRRGMLKPIDYDKHQAEVYAQGRAISPEAVAVWMAALVRHVGVHRPLTVLDLGCGTGRFTPGLADTFGGPVYGVEPSARMRAVAHQTAAHPGVTYLGGRAEQIPLADDSCDLVLMYLVLHHVSDRSAAAAEIARVLRPGGRAFVRSTFADRLPDPLWHQYFPSARLVEQQLFPTTTEVLDVFGDAGLRYVALEQVRHRFADSLAEYAARLRLRAISVFEYLPEPDDGDACCALEPIPVDGEPAGSGQAEPAPEFWPSDAVLLPQAGRDPLPRVGVDRGEVALETPCRK